MDVVDRKNLHQFHLEGARIKTNGNCIGYRDMYTGCIVTVVDEGNVTAIVREKESWEIITYYVLPGQTTAALLILLSFTLYSSNTPRIDGINWKAVLKLTIKDLFSLYSVDEQNFIGTISNPLSWMPIFLFSRVSSADCVPSIRYPDPTMNPTTYPARTVKINVLQHFRMT